MKSKYIAEKEKLIIDSGSSINFIDSGKIILCQQHEEMIIFKMADSSSFEIRFSIDELSMLLEESSFIRTDEKHLINLKYLEQIPDPKSNYIELVQNIKVPVDKARKKIIIETLEKMDSF